MPAAASIRPWRSRPRGATAAGGAGGETAGCLGDRGDGSDSGPAGAGSGSAAGGSPGMAGSGAINHLVHGYCWERVRPPRQRRLPAPDSRPNAHESRRLRRRPETTNNPTARAKPTAQGQRAQGQRAQGLKNQEGNLGGRDSSRDADRGRRRRCPGHSSPGRRRGRRTDGRTRSRRAAA